MSPRTACIGLVTVLSVGCSPATRHRVLTFFFDGVPPLESEAETAEAQAREAGVTIRPEGYAHGPYAARLCDSCHAEAPRTGFVVPAEQLCARCHEVALEAEYLHGPYASGSCVACHDPHGSRYRHLLVAEPARSCRRCHELTTHEDVGDEPCTSCHEPHASGQEYLLR